jgi:hypothetical protein
VAAAAAQDPFCPNKGCPITKIYDRLRRRMPGRVIDEMATIQHDPD